MLLFGADTNANLFDACCRVYDSKNKGRFSYGRTLLLLAVLLNRADPSAEFPRRLRVLRNLIEASESEFRPHRLPALVADVERIIVHGSLEEIKGFNKAQAEDERAKWAFLDGHPELAPTLFRLEDHHLLHGSLQAFALDAETFEHRVTAFELLMAAPDSWRALTGALLAAGEYARRRNDRDLQFGSPSASEPWRKLLTGTARANLTNTAMAMGAVLDVVAAGTAWDTSLREFRDAFLRERKQEGHFDWRYYLVRYEAMREGASGIYASIGGAMGYRICMLNKTQMNGNYRDPYLTALIREAGVGGDVIDGERGPFFIGGYVEQERWMWLRASGMGLHCSADGFRLKPPRDKFLERFHEVCANFGIDEQLKLVISQQWRDNRHVDTEDRIQVGASLLRGLIGAGL
jgi:hypothetical protein